MPTKDKLTYFDGRGRAEIIRYVYAVAGVEYEDIRIPMDKWPGAYKAATPFGQVPMLEVDGIKLCQSNTCARYLARKYHLAGKTELEQAQADMFVDCFEDAGKPLITFIFEKDETKQAEMKKKYVEEQLPGYLTHLEALLKSNHGGDGYLVGTELTWADLALLIAVMWLNMAGLNDEFIKFPKLQALREKVEKQPKVAAWIAKRPATAF